MDSEQAEKFSRLVTALWSESSKRNDYGSVIKIGLHAYSIFDLVGQSEYAEACLEAIGPAIDAVLGGGPKTMPRTSGAVQACSFCGKAPPEIKLGAGPSAFICNECVAIFSNIFNEGQK
jgi:ClpX C4-type zinc finger